MLLRSTKHTVLFLVLSLLLTTTARADTDHLFDSFTLYFENDFFSGTDRDYTSGVKLTWSTPYLKDDQSSTWPSWTNTLMSRLPMVNDSTQQHAISLSLGQEIYTPEDIKSEELIPDDRPYAGRTYVAMGLHSKKGHRQSSWELSLGILGSASLAENAQKLVHTINGNTDPRGWDNQLENELTFDVLFSTQWKIRPSGIQKKFSYEFLPHISASVGTVNTYANVGGEFRFGWDIPDDFGTCTIRAGCEVNNAFNGKKPEDSRTKGMGFHFFVAAEGKMVLRDIYLDGNTFRDSHSVDKELFVADLIAGFSVCYERLKMTYSYVQQTRQFETQDEGQAFSSFNISWLF